MMVVTVEYHPSSDSRPGMRYLPAAGGNILFASHGDSYQTDSRYELITYLDVCFFFFLFMACFFFFFFGVMINKKKLCLNILYLLPVADECVEAVDGKGGGGQLGGGWGGQHPKKDCGRRCFICPCLWVFGAAD